MYGEPTVAGDLTSFLWFIGDVAFKWIPGTIVAVTGGGDLSVIGAPPPIAPITTPVSPNEISNYLANAASAQSFDQLYASWSNFVALSTLVSLVFAAILVYSIIRIKQIRHLERLRLQAAQHPVKAHDVPKTHLRWERIKEQTGSDSEQQWRLAILEADIMLNELLDVQGYRGETMGEKMKAVDRANFNTIDLAWEAHKIRNRIAHEGSAHLLNAREARRVISLYERVFKEFRVVE